MRKTYRAMLRGDRVEWIDTPPAPPSMRPTPIRITMLEEDAAAVPVSGGQAMARALEALAQAGGLTGIPDPAAWQREVRDDRALPGRGD